MPSRSTLILIAFLVSLVAWTIGLLMPIPHGSTEALGGDLNKLIFSKVLHALAYAYLTVLGGLLILTTRQRWFVLAFLSFHGFATEFLQTFVNRNGCLRDVGVDHIGIALGLIASWPRWRILWSKRSEAK